MKYGLLGRKLGHSHSPELHRAFGCPDYGLFEVEPEELEAFLRREDIAGLNVTIPYKRAVLPYLQALSPEAEAIGSVNTIVRRPDGSLWGDNTDARGLNWALERSGISLEGRKVLIFGSGGASLAVRGTAAAGSAREVVVISRSGEDNYENLHRHRDAEILINATPLGMYPAVEDLPAHPGDFPACRGVVDLVYNPLRSRFLQEAAALGIPCCGGLGMLAAQAALSEEDFFGKAIGERELQQALGDLSRKLESIVLIGMPGCGKSTIGRLLARRSGRKLVDTDALVEKRAGCSIPEIFRREGEAAFRAMEKAAIAEAALEGGIILVTGGGSVLDRANLPPLKQNGRIYHLERSTALLARQGRPLSQSGDLETMYRQRIGCYEAFRDAVIPNEGSPEETAAAIWEDFCGNTGH